MACLALALLPLAAWGQTGPWLHVTFTMGMHAVPLGAAAWLAALAVAAAAVRRARKGRWPSAGLGGLMLMALLAGAAWLAASLHHAPQALAQGARAFALSTSPADWPLSAGQSQRVELRNETGHAITLQTIAIRGDAQGRYTCLLYTSPSPRD